MKAAAAAKKAGGAGKTATSSSEGAGVVSGSSGNTRPPSASATHSHSHNHANTMDFHDENGMSLQGKIGQLEKDLERRQESYITRERAYKMRIDELEEELAAQREAKTGWMKADSKIHKLKSMHSQILSNVELVQDRTARILQEQESDLLRAFRARLFDVQSELEKEKNKKDDGAAAWIERSRQLEAEVEWAKEVADRLERVNQTLLQENNRLKSQFTSQEEDRNFLIKQLVAVKKDNARLRAEYTELESESEKMKEQVLVLQQQLESSLQGNTPAGKPSGAVPSGAHQKNDADDRKLNVRLQRLLAEERKALQQVRQNYASELKVRTDMEMLLRQCVEDVRKEIARRYVEEGQFAGNAQGNDLARLYSKNPGAIPVDDFTQGDRERVLELLLSQERVVSLIYAKTFPVHNNNANSVLASNNHSTNHLMSNNSMNNMDLNGLLDPNMSDFPPSPTTGNGSPGGDGRPGTGHGHTKIPALPPVVTGTKLGSR